MRSDSPVSGGTLVEVRDTTEADVEVVAAMIDAVARERKFLAGTVGFPVDGVRAFLHSVRAAGGVHVVARVGGEVVGWCDVFPSPFEGMRHVGRLGMGVRPEHRSRGVGAALLAGAVERAFAGAIERIELEVFASNTSAIRLYETRGFELEGRKVAARRLDGVTDDILVYAKRKVVR